MKDLLFEEREACIITGPTAGIGRATALEAAKHWTLILVGRDRRKLIDLQRVIERNGGDSVSVICDLSDMRSVRKAAAEIITLQLPITRLLNNAGIFELRATKNAQGWDNTFATDHLGPFLLTELLVPHLPDGSHVVFVASGVEDPDRGPAKASGFRGGRYISAEASARGAWIADGSKTPGADAYATAKQCNLATALELARETPRLHFNAVEPGFTPGTEFGRQANFFLRFLLKYVLPLIAPFMKYWSTPKRAGRVITQILANEAGVTGVYFDDGGQPSHGSTRVHDPKFSARVVAETRALLEPFTSMGAVLSTKH